MGKGVLKLGGAELPSADEHSRRIHDDVQPGRGVEVVGDRVASVRPGSLRHGGTVDVLVERPREVRRVRFAVVAGDPEVGSVLELRLQLLRRVEQDAACRVCGEAS